MQSRMLWALACGCALSLPACKKEKEDNRPKTDLPAEPGEASLQVAAGDPPVEGPVPPEVSMVFFTVEGALYPLGCFDAEKKKILSGEACLAMVPEGSDVRLSSLDAEYNKKAQGRVEPQCLIGSGQTIAVGVEGITEGADFVYATWPQPAMKQVKPVSHDTTSPSATQLDEATTQKLLAAIKAAGGPAEGEVRAQQIAEVEVDGDEGTERIYAVYVPHPQRSEQYAWSGAFLAPEGTADELVLLEESKTKRDVFEIRGVVDLDGAAPYELWSHLTFEEGGGDRLLQLRDGKVSPLGGWTCGAG